MFKFFKSKLLALLVACLGLFFFTQTAFAASLTNVSVTPDSNNPSVSTNHTLSFRTSATGAIGASGTIWVNYPSGFNLSNVTLGSYTGNLGTATLSRGTTTAIITLGPSGNVENNDVVSFQLVGVINTATNGSYTVSMETRTSTSQNIDGPTNSSSFTIGQVQTLDHFRVVPSTTSAVVGQDVTLTITAQDASNATVTNYSGIPTLSGLANSPNNTVPYYGSVSFSNGVANVIVRSYSSGANQSVTVTDSGKTGNSGMINFSSGALNTINIPFSDQTITAGQTIQFSATCFDSYLNQRSGDPISWTGTNSSGLFNNTTAGTYTVRASSGTINSNSVSVRVNPGALNSISISPSSNQSIKAGQTIQFTVVSYDSYGNQRTGDTFSWTNTNSNGFFNLTTAGNYQVKASLGSINSNSVTVIVTHTDTIDHLAISPTDIHLSNSDQTQAYSATAYDSYNNSWDVTAQAAFSTSDPKGSFQNNVYSAGKIGIWEIKATAGNKEITTHVTIDNPGASSKVEFSNAISQLNINTIYQFRVKVYDADDNEISNPTLSWTVTEGYDNATIDINGRFLANKAGTYKVKVQSGSVSTILTFTVVETTPKQEESQKSKDTTPSQPEVAKKEEAPAKTTTQAVVEKEEVAVAVEDQDDQGKIKAMEVVTEGPEKTEQETSQRTKMIVLISLILALAILALAYWGYTAWGVRAEKIAEKVTTISKDSSKTEKKEVQDIPEIAKDDSGQEKTRW